MLKRYLPEKIEALGSQKSFLSLPKINISVNSGKLNRYKATFVGKELFKKMTILRTGIARVEICCCDAIKNLKTFQHGIATFENTYIPQRCPIDSVKVWAVRLITDTCRIYFEVTTTTYFPGSCWSDERIHYLNNPIKNRTTSTRTKDADYLNRLAEGEPCGFNTPYSMLANNIGWEWPRRTITPFFGAYCCNFNVDCFPCIEVSEISLVYPLGPPPPTLSQKTGHFLKNNSKKIISSAVYMAGIAKAKISSCWQGPEQSLAAKPSEHIL
ncbi:MAG: hypothetical protein V4487_03475 [Chlamydiota bacterium]